jgi:hypothetical protein
MSWTRMLLAEMPDLARQSTPPVTLSMTGEGRLQSVYHERMIARDISGGVRNLFPDNEAQKNS